MLRKENVRKIIYVSFRCKIYYNRRISMKALVLFSGGVDSTTCLGMAIDKYGKDNVIALSISYGQKHTKEIEASNKIVEYYGV